MGDELGAMVVRGPDGEALVGPIKIPADVLERFQRGEKRFTLHFHDDEGRVGYSQEVELVSPPDELQRREAYFVEPGAPDSTRIEVRLKGKDDKNDVQRALTAAILPDARRGRKVKRGAQEGGRERLGYRKGPQDNKVLEDMVLKRHTTHPQDVWSKVCKWVGGQVGLSRRTVEERAAAVDWRK